MLWAVIQDFILNMFCNTQNKLTTKKDHFQAQNNPVSAQKNQQ